MPNIKAAKKDLRQAKRRHSFNAATKKKYRGAVKEVVKSISEGSKEKAMEGLKLAMKQLDKAAKKNIIKKGAAARKKSRLAKAINKIS